MEPVVPSIKTKKEHTNAVGRRKEAVARVRLVLGNGKFIVNAKPVTEYFIGQMYEKMYNRPFDITKTLGKYDTSVKVEGGGRVGQMDAIIHGIARTLVKIDAELRTTLKKAGLLTRDPRVRERRKFGLAHKARAKKQSPKR